MVMLDRCIGIVFDCFEKGVNYIVKFICYFCVFECRGVIFGDGNIVRLLSKFSS